MAISRVAIKTVCSRVASLIAHEFVTELESKMGHAHGPAHADAAATAAEAWVSAAAMDPWIEAVAAFLEARYAAGNTPGPIMDTALMLAPIQIAAADGAGWAAGLVEEGLGHSGHSAAEGTVVHDLVDGVVSVDGALAADLQALFQQLDANLAAYVDTHAAGGAFNAFSDLLKYVAVGGALTSTIDTFEDDLGHHGHAVAHGGTYGGSGGAYGALAATAAVAALLAACDARYQAHA